MFRALFLSLTLLLPAVAKAQTLSFDGVAAVGATDIHGGSGLAFVDMTLALPLSSHAPLRLEIGTLLYGLDGKRPHETYGAVAWNGAWRMGAVRPAYDTVLISAFTRAAPFLAYERAEYSRAHATVEAMRRTAVPWGLSWTGGYDRTRFAVSAHDAVKGGFRSASASGSYLGNGWDLAAAVEAVWSRDGTHDGVNTKIGGGVTIGTSHVGLAWLRPEVNDRRDALSLDITVQMSRRLDLLGFGEVTKTGKDDAYGIALDYRMKPDTDMISAVSQNARGSIVHLTLERRF